ncbi:prolyl hydroxylase family protein [Acinetobacter sp.]|uniref:prolyl hydroxylase family protein n=1 Tax=Acinetobacter sp. TaxID=472 RepID=UPI0038900066
MFYKHLSGVLTPEMCVQLRGRGDNQGFEEALVNRGDGTEEMIKRVRNNDRVIFDDDVLALSLEILLRAHLDDDFPSEFKGAKFHSTGTKFRIYKYVPGQYFKPHRDGSVDLGTSASEITVLFYLNDTDGGETILMPYGKGQEWAFIPIVPKAGDVLMFEHNFWHEGKPVNSGEKYVLRTDLFYAYA